jgi:hypothetical protein
MFEVSFNSPQCGWMSIGFTDGVNEFHTTTAHAPHAAALPELMRILTDLATKGGNPQPGAPAAASASGLAAGREGADSVEYTLQWNRDPEEYDFRFLRNGDSISIEICQFPTDEREAAKREIVYSHTGPLKETIDAFAVTFEQLYQDRDTDEFEFNWRQPFPFREYEEFKERMGRG